MDKLQKTIELLQKNHIIRLAGNEYSFIINQLLNTQSLNKELLETVIILHDFLIIIQTGTEMQFHIDIAQKIITKTKE